MLMNFRDTVREASYPGSHAVHVAMGLAWLDQMIAQSASQLDRAKNEEKEMLKRAKAAIADAGGKINGGEIHEPGLNGQINPVEIH